jgi:hypothetical protein
MSKRAARGYLTIAVTPRLKKNDVPHVLSAGSIKGAEALIIKSLLAAVGILDLLA